MTKVYTNQEAFDIVYKGLEAQGWKQSLKEDSDDCCFRGRNNTKCAIGHLIPDELYEPEMERHGLDVAEQDGVIHLDKSFASQMMVIHDLGRTPELMKKKFIDLAEQHKLTVPE